jgi:hypothetical protein
MISMVYDSESVMILVVRLSSSPKTSRDPHVGFYLWELRAYKPCSSNVYNQAGIPAENGGDYQSLDAVTYQASFPCCCPPVDNLFLKRHVPLDHTSKAFKACSRPISGHLITDEVMSIT